MNGICIISPAASELEFHWLAVIGEYVMKPFRSGCCVSGKQKSYSPESRLLELPTAPRTSRAFSIAARFQYGRVNQPNEQAGCATRTCAGGNGGLYRRASAGASSLFGQAFKPMFEDCKSLRLPLAKDGSVRTHAERLSET